MKLDRLYQDFTSSERASGIALIGCTIISLTATNLLPSYAAIWNFEFVGHSVTHWINDGLMTIFFLLIGLELEREVYQGELSSIKKAMLPAISALGGMAVPALIYFFINNKTGILSGIGVPMATDIAFALAALSLLGKRVPFSLKVFLTAFAVIDDLGAIIIIAIFYTNTIHWINLGIALVIWALLFLFNRLKIHTTWPYVLGGLAMWFSMLNSGVHATITGVMLAFAIPFGDGTEQAVSYRLQHVLHKPVAFIILPLFALANTSIALNSEIYDNLGSAISVGIMAGLVIGKPLGIFSFAYTAVKLKLSTLSEDINWKLILGAGMLGGIGFTMSIFISLLAFSNGPTVDQAKVAVLLASLASGVLGFVFLKTALQKKD